MKKEQKNKLYKRIGLAISMTLILGSNAIAAPANIKSGRETSQPIGHYDFCQKYSAECNVKSSNVKPVKLTRKRWGELVEANAYANATIQPVTDLDYYGVHELWAYPERYGDCEDFVLLKRHMLMSKGWPASSLLITVVKQQNGDGHAILTARTDRGDFILDNLEDKIDLWRDTQYHFVKRQMPRHSGKWQNVLDQRKHGWKYKINLVS